MEMLSSALSVGAPLFGSLVSADALIDQGYAVRKEKNFEAFQMEMNAEDIDAAGTHAIGDNVNKYEVLISKAIAINGAAGGGAEDPTFLKMIAGLAEEGERSRQRIAFSYTSKSSLMRRQAKATRFEGEEFRKGSRKKAMATLLTGAGRAATNFLAKGTTIGATANKRLLDFS